MEINETYKQALDNYNKALDEVIKSSDNWYGFLRVMGNCFGLPHEAQLIVWQKDPTSIGVAEDVVLKRMNYDFDDSAALIVPINNSVEKYHLISDIVKNENSKPITIWHTDTNDYYDIKNELYKKFHIKYQKYDKDITQNIRDYSRSIDCSNKNLSELFHNSLEDVLLGRLEKETSLSIGYEYNLSGISKDDIIVLIKELNYASKGFLNIAKAVAKKNNKYVNYTFANKNEIDYNKNVINSKEVSDNDRTGSSKSVRSNFESKSLRSNTLPHDDIRGVRPVHSSGGTGVLHSSSEQDTELHRSERRGIYRHEVDISGSALAEHEMERTGRTDKVVSGGTSKRSGTEKIFSGNRNGNVGQSNDYVGTAEKSTGNSRITGHRLLEICSRIRNGNETSKRILSESTPLLQLNLFDNNNNTDKTAEFDKNDPAVFLYTNLENSILSGTGFVDGKFRVFEFFSENHSKNERIDFLKNEYGIGGQTFTFTDETRGSLSYSGKGYFITDSNKITTQLNWNEITTIIETLIDSGIYLSDDEKKHYPIYLEEKKERKIRSDFLHEIDNLFRDEKHNLKKLSTDIQAQRRNMFEYQQAFINGDNSTDTLKSIYDLLTICSHSELNNNGAADKLLDKFKEFAPELFTKNKIEEYFKLQEEKQDSIVLVKNGTFFEIMGNKAEAAANTLDLVLTSRTKNNSKILLCGFPDSRAEEYTDKLLQNNYTIVLAEYDDYNNIKVTDTIIPSEETVTVSEELTVQTAEEIIDEAENLSENQILTINDFVVDMPSSKKRLNTTTHRNYKSLIEITPLLFNKNISYIRLSAGDGYMPLVIEKIGNGMISVAHYYEQNGDLMRDPEIEFLLDTNKEELRPRSYVQDNIGAYQYLEKDNGSIDPIEEAQLSKFTSNWFNNIKWQSYKTERILFNYKDEDISLIFDEEGNLTKIDSDLAEEFINDFNIELSETHNDVSLKVNNEKSDKTAHQTLASSDKHDYIIKDDNIGTGTKSERYKANIEAIKVLKQIESENRFATSEEQEILSKYVGWGGLAEVFDDSNSKYDEISSILTDEELKAARSSTLTAFYTPPIVIKSIYSALENMGFNKGSILEPSCGIGNFFGLIPDSISSNVKLYGIELDSISGRIAKQLYQNADIQIKGFEDTKYTNDSFDVVIGNVPFGQFKVVDKDYDKHNFLIHDFFFAKAIDKVKPGGIIAFITSKGTMDKSNPSVRKYISKRADLLGAIRLPDNTFKRSAGTEVTSDIIFLQKRDTVLDIEPEWVRLTQNENNITMNSYFIDHPQMILGDMQMVSTAYGFDSACKDNGKDLSEQLIKAIINIKGTIKTQQDITFEINSEGNANDNIPAIEGVKDGAFAIIDNCLYVRDGSEMKIEKVSEKQFEKYKAFVQLRDICQELINTQADGATDEQVQVQQERLNNSYDHFVSKYGRISDNSSKRLFDKDPGYSLLSSLEKFDSDGNFKRKSDMFYKRTIRPNRVITSAKSSNDALMASLAVMGHIDMSYMMDLTGFSQDEIEADLTNIIFREPKMDDNQPVSWVTADEYLSGNVRNKLDFAKICLKLKNEQWIQNNISALEKVQPKPLKASEISVKLGATWIPNEIISEFVYHLLKTTNRGNIKANYSEMTGSWHIENKDWEYWSVAAKSTYGTSRANGYNLLEDCLNLKDTVIRDPVYEDGKTKYVVNEKETRLAQGKQKLIRQEFDNWIFSNPNRRKQLEEIYNRKFNSCVQRKYDGSHLFFDGMNCNITLRPHQKNAVARCLYGGNTLLAHTVGAGKSATRS